MNIDGINKAIIGVCGEITRRQSVIPDWRGYREIDLLKELVFCIICSQMKYELAYAITKRVMELEIIQNIPHVDSNTNIFDCILNALKQKVQIVLSDGSVVEYFPRFSNRISAFITNTLKVLYQNNKTIKMYLENCNNAYDARKIFVEEIKGIGPKQASLFLRRIGYSSELAVIDTHIMDYMRLSNIINIKPAAITKISNYEKIEKIYTEHARSFGYPLGCIDLAMWITMRVAKMEAYI